jgi:hypothetical protein
VRVCVEYVVPVTVTVDLDTAKVEKVNVWNEEIARVDDPKHRPYREGSMEPVTKFTAQDAVRIAEKAEWPAWKFGP